MAVLPLRNKVLAAVSCWLLLAILAIPLKAEEARQDPPPAATQDVVPAADEGVEGIASYYAKRYTGRRTTSGERYRPEKLTAAHPDLPLGSRVKVINLANDNEVEVTVNDRCRRKKIPFIDLSRAAAQELGFFGKGIAKVRIIPLEDESLED